MGEHQGGIKQKPIPLSSVPGAKRAKESVTDGRYVCWPSPAFCESLPMASVHARGTSAKLLLAKGKSAGTQARSENAPSCCDLGRSRGEQVPWRGLRGSSPPLTPTPAELGPSHFQRAGILCEEGDYGLSAAKAVHSSLGPAD